MTLKNTTSLSPQAAILIKQAGLKVTPGRQAVLATLIEAAEPLSIDTLKHRVGSTVNIVTLYRMLSQFVTAGLVYQTDFRNGKAYFEYQTTHHHHIVCTSCGTKEEIATCVPKSLTREVSRSSHQFKNITSHILEFFGECRKCQE